MAKTLGVIETDLFYCQRSRQNATVVGDFFAWAFANTSTFTDTQYTNLVSAYLDNEEEADNAALTGTRPDASTFQITQAPTRPQPITHRP